ncbi:beta strand repeat-containing protein [Campylobacter fetus]|uniref:Surface array protein A n=1 Tax=Campylobacter fetus subsp. venerealis NCTC 10354 TaxID=983328 RepID=A0AAE6IXW6_CAMFE|nr:cell surface protein [Campylobacter fetus]QEL44482.1 surface array protein A [Campylobacter fetus subsp. venerealis NCTC 10354]
MLNKTDVSMLYITIMGMASEGDGNKYWLDYANNNSLGVSSLANIMLDSPGAAKFFGDSLLAGNEKDFVTKIYSIALGNTSDVDGINYWTKAITGGGEFTDSKGNVISVASLSKGDLIGAMINSMVNGGSAESKAIFEAKAAASDYFADATLGKDISGLDEGTTSKLISEINSASDLDKVKSEIDGLKESIDEAGLNKIALTTENDTITGTEGGDLISGVVSSLASENTLNAGDVIDGGAGSDILKVDLKSNFTGLDSSGVIKGVEKISLLNSGLISRTFDAKGIKDVQTLALNSEKGIEVKNLANIADIELTNLQAANFNVDSIYADKVLDGSADVQNLKVNGVGAKGASVAITADKIENLSLNATGKDSFLKDITSKDVSVKGNANLSLATGAKTTTLDASSFGGALDADLSTSASVTSIKGGNGNDKITIKDVAVNVAIDGGAGNDELVIKGAGTLKPTVANIEKVTLDATGALTLAMDNAKDVSELNIKGDKGAVTVVNSNISSLNFLSTVEGTNAVTIDSENLATINYKAGTEAAEIKGNLTATKATNLTVNTDALANITNTGATLTANSATSMSLNINAEKTAQSLKLSATKLKDLAVVNKSVDGFTIKGDANSLDALSNLNVTTDGKFSFDTITGLAGVSTVTLSGANDKSAVTLGDLGSDKVTQGIALNASGLKGGLEVGNTVTKGSININLNAMSGDAKLGAANSETDNLSISVNGVEGKFETQALKAAASTTVSLTNIKGASTIASLNGATTSLSIENTGDVTISNASSALEGDFSINANNANGLTTGVITANKGAISINANGVSAITVGNLSAKSSITLNAGDASTSVKAGDIAADSVNVDLSKVLGTTTVGKIKSDNIIYKASELSADTASKIALASKGNIQNFKAEVTGSLGDDKIELTTAATTSSVTLSGDLGVGNDTVDINETSAVDALKTVNLSGLTNYATSTTKLKAAASDTLTFNGGSGDDSVEVSGTAIASLKVIGDFGGGNLDKLTLGTNATAITGADSAVIIDITKVTNVDSTEINFTNTATDMSDKALTINGSESNDQVTLKLAANTTKVKVDGDLGDGNDTFVFDIGAATATSITDIDLIGLKGVEVGLHGADAATAFDFSTYTGLTTFNATTGADNIKLGKLTESAVVNLGSGDDKIETGAFTASKTLTIDSGIGSDYINISASKVATAADTKEMVIISDVAANLKGDTIKFGTTIANAGSITAADQSWDTDLKTTLKNAIATADANKLYVVNITDSAAGDSKGTYLFYNGNADQVISVDDIIVKLSGVSTTDNLTFTADSDGTLTIA